MTKCKRFGLEWNIRDTKMEGWRRDRELFHRKALVAKCMAEYSFREYCKPDNKFVWRVSRGTAQNLHVKHLSVPALPTIPEGSWNEVESEDSCEDISSEEDSLCANSGSVAEGTVFSSVFH